MDIDIKSLKELRNKYRRTPVAILGAGPSLPDDLKKIPDDSILMGVNHHCAGLVNLDYVVFSDNPVNIPDLWKVSNQHAGRRLTQIRGFSDWDFSGVDYWDGGMTATMATWLACYMRADPVLLCGMDCFQSGKKYFHNKKMSDHPCHTYPLENHLQAWRKVFLHCKQPGVIRAVSGPLAELFGEYNVEKVGHGNRQ